MFSMLIAFGTLALLASTCNAKATGAERGDAYDYDCSGCPGDDCEYPDICNRDATGAERGD